jgi:pilus assembly protein FimV
MDSLLSPLTLGGAAAVILLLAAYGYYRRRKQKRGSSRGATKLNSDFLSDGKLTSDSYFGASGGQRVDTGDGSSAEANSSMAYSPSQLEAVGDVDPVSEADVYLAYGRDAQAEEILREALRTYPGRSSIYVKLAEIYAKQRDARQLAAIATEARRVTHGEGHDWQTIVNLGSELDPANPLYAPAAAAAPAPAVQPVQPPPHRASANLNPRDLGQRASPQTTLDMDLTDNAPLLTPAPQANPPTAPGGSASRAPVQPAYSAPTMPASMVPSSTAETEPLPLTAQHWIGTNPTPLSADHSIDFTPPAPTPSPAQPNSGMMEFNPSVLGITPALRPAQNTQSVQKNTQQAEEEEDPQTTKLALAQEFHAIGDDSSARSLAREVLAEATGALKTKAEQFLNDLD